MIMDAGVQVKTVRPEIGGLEAVVLAADRLSGERADPYLPIRYGAIKDYADQMGMSGVFVALVQYFDMKRSESWRLEREGKRNDRDRSPDNGAETQGSRTSKGVRKK